MVWSTAGHTYRCSEPLHPYHPNENSMVFKELKHWSSLSSPYTLVSSHIACLVIVAELTEQVVLVVMLFVFGNITNIYSNLSTFSSRANILATKS